MSEKKNEKKKGSKLLIILLILSTLVVVGVAAYFMFYVRPANLTASGKSQKQLAEKTVALDEFIVNLNDQYESKYLKIDLALAYTDTKTAQNITDRMPEIRDVIIRTLREKSSTDFSQGKLEKVISDLVTNVNSVLTGGKITNIYLTNFLIQ